MKLKQPKPHGNTALFTAMVASLQRIEGKLDQILVKGTIMAFDLTALKDAVAKDTEVDQSAVTLLNGLTAKIQELINASGNTVDPAELQAVVDGIKGTTDALAAAVVANTPAEPTP